MPKYFLVAKNGQEARSSRAFSASDVRALKSAPDCYTFIGELTNRPKNVGACRTGKKRGMAGAPAWWPFGHKKAKPAARHPMTRTVYYARTASGTYKPVDRPPSSAVMAGVRRRKRKARR